MGDAAAGVSGDPAAGGLGEPAPGGPAPGGPGQDAPASEEQRPITEDGSPGGQAATNDAPAEETDTEHETRLTGMPEYKGEPLDAERGPGLGCFWIQIALLTFFLIFTPLTVTWGWDPFISGALLIFTLVLLLFSGQTIIFLLRLVAADRRTRRTPLDPSAKPTVGQMEDAAPVDEGAPGAGERTARTPGAAVADGAGNASEASSDRQARDD
jgi:hypothetical protein